MENGTFWRQNDSAGNLIIIQFGYVYLLHLVCFHCTIILNNRIVKVNSANEYPLVQCKNCL